MVVDPCYRAIFKDTEAYLVWPIFLSQDSKEWSSKNVRYEEHRQDDIVAMISKLEVLLETSGFRISQIARTMLAEFSGLENKVLPLVETVEQVHDSQNGQNPQIKFPNKFPLGDRINCCKNLASIGNNSFLSSFRVDFDVIFVVIIFAIVLGLAFLAQFFVRHVW